MTISHDAQLILLGALISLVSSIITALVNHYLSLHADKVRRTRDKDASLKSIIVPTSSTLPDIADRNKFQIRNVASHSYGISFVGEIVYNVVNRSDSVPVERSISLYSQRNVEKKVELLIWENPSGNVTVEASHCFQIGSLGIDSPNGIPVGPPLDVTFRLDDQGALEVTVEDPISRRVFSTMIETKRSEVRD